MVARVLESGAPTLVLRVRFIMVPALMMRSNSKQPYWLTGDMTPALFMAAVGWSGRGCDGVPRRMPAERMVMGFEGVCGASARVAMVAGSHSRRGACQE